MKAWFWGNGVTEEREPSAGGSDETEDYFGTIVDLLKRIIGSLNPEEVLTYLTEPVTHALHPKAPSVRLLDDAAQSLALRAVSRLSPPSLNKGPFPLTAPPIH